MSTSTYNLKNRGGGSGLDYVILLSQGGSVFITGGVDIRAQIVVYNVYEEGEGW